jgi:hypothetical protein
MVYGGITTAPLRTCRTTSNAPKTRNAVPTNSMASAARSTLLISDQPQRLYEAFIQTGFQADVAGLLCGTPIVFLHSRR